MFGFTSLALLAAASLLIGGTATAADGGEADNIWDALTQGKPTLNFRFRTEMANITNESGVGACAGVAAGCKTSWAMTARTRLGYGTKPYKGVSAFVEMENTAPIAKQLYFDGIGGAGANVNDLTPIPDPKSTNLNQAYLKITNKDLLDSTIVGGRQRIIKDDARFIGNVGWRQNEQTYDAASWNSTFNVDGLNFDYNYIWSVRRIFGTETIGTGAWNDFSANTHLIHGSYDKLPVKITAFVYLTDISNGGTGATSAEANANATYGLRLNGKHDFNDDWNIAYVASFAYQTDWADFDSNGAAAGGITQYNAMYWLGDAKVGFKPAGALGGGIEVLGSWNGEQGQWRFSTPLATLHKWNGWADVWLNNGGSAGLRDFFVYYETPKMPWDLKGKAVFHYFKSDAGGDKQGWEIDGLLKKPINKHMDVLAKAAYYQAPDGGSAAVTGAQNDVVKVWLQTTIKF
ncbi:MAG: alginate export family protein [Deltaproteobacteria bacterium]|nr:alginate export family protein [Deltaproteobacteria bacterium]